jgi:autophagy-related protein 2
MPASVEDLTFKRMPELGPPPDMITDDLPTNMYYLDDSFGPAAGLREICDDDLDEFDTDDMSAPGSDDPNVISRAGGETIKILDSKGLEIVEDYFLNIPAETNVRPSE